MHTISYHRRSNKADLDFNAVQRGDAEMSQKLWRVVRSCVEMGDKNPIVQIHDQGAGGNCNVVKEIIYPLGAGEHPPPPPSPVLPPLYPFSSSPRTQNSPLSREPCRSWTNQLRAQRLTCAPSRSATTR